MNIGNVRKGVVCGMSGCSNLARIGVGTKLVCFDCMEAAKKEYLMSFVRKHDENLIIEEAARIIKERRK